MEFDYTTELHCAALRCTALHCAALRCAALRCTALHCTALHCTALRCTTLHTSSRFKQMRSVGANCCSAALTRSASPRFSDATNTSVSCTNGGLLVVRRTIGGTDPPHQRTYLPCSADRFSCCASTLSTPRLCLRVQPNRANTECSHVRAAEWPQRSSLGLTVPIDSCE